MGNEATKKQIQDWLERKVEEAKNPDPVKLKQKELKEKRNKKKKTIEKKHGL